MTLADFAMGYKAPIVPGAFKGWAAALERYGTMSLGDLFEPAIRLAEDGFVFSKFDERYTQSSADKLSRYPSTTRVFFPNGRPPRMGEIIRQPELAASMRHLARAGRTTSTGVNSPIASSPSWPRTAATSRRRIWNRTRSSGGSRSRRPSRDTICTPCPLAPVGCRCSRR